MKEGLASLGNVARANRFWHVMGVKLQKSAEARNPNAVTCYNGRIHKQERLLNEGSLYPCPKREGLSSNKSRDEKLTNRVKVADEPVVVMKSGPMKSW